MVPYGLSHPLHTLLQSAKLRENCWVEGESHPLIPRRSAKLSGSHSIGYICMHVEMQRSTYYSWRFTPAMFERTSESIIMHGSQGQYR